MLGQDFAQLVVRLGCLRPVVNFRLLPELSVQIRAPSAQVGRAAFEAPAHLHDGGGRLFFGGQDGCELAAYALPILASWQ